MASRSRSAPAAFAAGFSFALVVCAGVLAERVSRGALDVAVFAQTVTTLAALCIARAASAAKGREFSFAAHAVGGALAILVAHAVVRSSSVADSGLLVERPAQLVNDAVAVFAPLAIIWASTRRPPSTLALAATLLVVIAYHASGSAWHLDAGRFDHSVQDLVTAQLGASTVGVTTLRVVLRGC